MPAYFIPRKSSAHRIACKALYRALLEQCPRIPLPPELPSRGAINPIKHFIRKKFRQSIYLTSPKQVVKGLKAGYAAEQLLRYAGNGNPTALSQVHTLLEMLHAETAHARLVTPKPIPRHRPRRPAPYPGAKKVLEVRPLPKKQLTGRRHVPRIQFTNAGQTPFLFFKKPQSEYLGRVLRQLGERRTQRILYQQEIETTIRAGKLEAQWENLVENELEAEGRDVDTVSNGDDRWGDVKPWIAPLKESHNAIEANLTKADRKAKKMTRQMMSIHIEEKRLWMEERKERKREKNEARRAGKARRREDANKSHEE